MPQKSSASPIFHTLQRAWIKFASGASFENFIKRSEWKKFFLIDEKITSSWSHSTLHSRIDFLKIFGPKSTFYYIHPSQTWIFQIKNETNLNLILNNKKLVFKIVLYSNNLVSNGGFSYVWLNIWQNV